MKVFELAEWMYFYIADFFSHLDWSLMHSFFLFFFIKKKEKKKKKERDLKFHMPFFQLF